MHLTFRKTNTSYQNKQKKYLSVFLWNKETIIWAPKVSQWVSINIYREEEIMGLNSLHIKSCAKWTTRWWNFGRSIRRRRMRAQIRDEWLAIPPNKQFNAKAMSDLHLKSVTDVAVKHWTKNMPGVLMMIISIINVL